MNTVTAPLVCRVPLQIRYYENVDLNGFDIPRSVLKYIRKKYQRGYYHCCGQGNIGHHLLHRGLVDTMHFTDIYEPALEGCKETVDLHGWMATFSQDLIDDQFDLFIADPPWWNRPFSGSQLSNHEMRLLIDQDWHAHKKIFSWLPDHLTPDGDAYIIKDSGHSEFYDLLPEKMIVKGEYSLHYFSPGYDCVRSISRSSLLHLAHR